ncbi:16S rRNA (guanine(527)-N(7))-methyltransferase RsmG [Lentisalinibacter sediminis]|uniref:16S rRNA (guanine(527)-N(7))-methyltransferase RsmG n=1 Tax=Lentisalinibacter sediminis TaxID=2992237 RepID=UPI003863886A
MAEKTAAGPAAADPEAEKLEKAISRGAAALGQQLPAAAAARLARLLLLLAKWSRAYNLTAVRRPGDMVTEHVLDALSIRPWLDGHRIADVGTGAGLPGLVLAIVEPERRFTLLDASGKKLRFVRHAVAELGLANVEVVQARVEDYAPEAGFDTVLCRAFAPLPRFVESSAHLITGHGKLLAQKGLSPDGELGALPPGWAAETAPVTVPGLAKTRHVVSLRRTEKAA